MKNKVNKFNESPSRIEIVTGLLSRMDGDIVAPDGTLPDVTVDKVGKLHAGAGIHISVPNSEQCFLETDNPDVQYQSNLSLIGPNIHYWEKVENPVKHSMKEKNYHFHIRLAGQRSRG